MRSGTRLVHPPRCATDTSGAVTTPLYQTATFANRDVLTPGAYDYTRSGNPTRDVLEQQLAALEGGTRALAFASGMAAVSAVTRLAGVGDSLVASVDLYGGTHRLLHTLLARSGVEVRVVDTTDVGAVAAAVDDSTRLVLVETPSNPRQLVTDLRAVAAIAHRHGAWLAVDNSLLGPLLQQPLACGADLVIHSATKFLGGHSDLTAGAVVVSDPELAAALYAVQNGEGTALAPFDAWLLLRGIETLSVRQRCQQDNAAKVADLLLRHPVVEEVLWTGLPDWPGAAVHARQASGPGSVLSFTTGDLARSACVVDTTRLFHTAVSFGGVASSIGLPCRMSHASLPPKLRSLPEDLVRVSVGIEHPEDLLLDLGTALDSALAAGRGPRRVLAPGRRELASPTPGAPSGG